MFGWASIHVGVVGSKLLLLLCTSVGLFPSQFTWWVSSQCRVKTWFCILVRLRTIWNHITMFENCRSCYITVLLNTYRYFNLIFTIFGSVLGWTLARSLAWRRGSLSWGTRWSNLSTFVGILSLNLSLNHVILWRFQIWFVSNKILIWLSIHNPKLLIYFLTLLVLF